MELFLIRHPPPAVPEGTCYGRSDIGLAAPPAASAARLRGLLPDGIPVYTSPLMRCRSLAEALSPAPVTDARLVEMDFGEWELQRWDDIERAAFDAWAADILDSAPPGGESAAAMLARALDFFDELRRGGAPAAAVVSHAGLLRVLFAHWLEVPPRRWPRLVFEFGAVSKVILDAESDMNSAVLRVEYLNRK
ncbi:MAG: alpha-ribazole phosphatase family protein [Zoogloeaceae bacterium]|jgi:alpha-ribazole phosphatase|nr:alpha-ribazole phosphatase family protein [Zoogloeaceae bacterium]